MTDEDQLIQFLTQWGEWRSKNVKGLGYPSMSAEQRANEGGSIGFTSKVPGYEPDPVSNRVNEIIRSLTPDHQIALWCKYVQQMPHEKSAVACGVDTRYKYVRLLIDAERELAGKMGLKYRKI